jgi:CRISPR-associated endonuclease/helicase Cas3
LEVAVQWHDWGKAHEVFQNRIKDDANDGFQRPSGFAGRRDIAKAEGRFWGRSYRMVGGRPVGILHFRHELASVLGVLAFLNSGHTPKPWADLAPHLQNLALYLIAAHHGKVRLSIRSMPDEKTPDRPDALFARGVWEGDRLPEVKLGEDENGRDVIAPLVEQLDLSPMALGRVGGQPSWVERSLGLRDDKEKPDGARPRFGPLKLAYLEAVLRGADIRASKASDEEAKKAKEVQP